MSPVSHRKLTIVVFDLDGTITRYDTYIRFLLLVTKNSPLKLLRLPGLFIDVLRHKLGRQSNSWLKERFLNSLLAGETREAIDGLARCYVDKVLSFGIYSDALKAIKKYHDLDCKLVLLSASLDIYVVPLGEKLGFKHIICTKTNWKNDVLDVSLNGGNCYGEAKVKRLQQWMGKHSQKEIFAAFGDHETDFHLLKIARHGFVVNPDPKLSLQADSEMLEIVRWS